MWSLWCSAVALRPVFVLWIFFPPLEPQSSTGGNKQRTPRRRSAAVPPRFRRGSAAVLHGCRTGSARDPHGFRTGARVPHGIRTGTAPMIAAQAARKIPWPFTVINGCALMRVSRGARVVRRCGRAARHVARRGSVRTRLQRRTRDTMRRKQRTCRSSRTPAPRPSSRRRASSPRGRISWGGCSRAYSQSEVAGSIDSRRW